MALTVVHLGIVRKELFEARTKWYDIGLELNLPVATLDSIKLDGQFGNHSDKLLETLKVWLKTALKPTWQDIVDVLKSCVIGEPKLASDIEAKYCTTVTAETGQASGQTIPEVQQPQPTTGAEVQKLLHESREEQQRHIHTLQQKLQDSQRQIEELTHQVEKKHQQESIEKGLLHRDQTNVELRAANDQLSRQSHQAQQQAKEMQHAIEERGRQVCELTEQRQPMKRLGPLPQKAVICMQQRAIQDMRWQKEPLAPERMCRGSAAADSNVAYFNDYDSTKVHSYDSTTREWHQLPATPHTCFTLVVVQHILTIVGGDRSGEATNSLLSLTGEGRDEKWLPNLPEMPTKRYFTAAVCSGHYLIVSGGTDGCNRLTTVEVFNTDTRQWFSASSLTYPFSEATISICGERLYMLGGLDQTGQTRSVLSCSVPELLQSCQPQPLAENLRTAPVNHSTIWRRVADAPHYLSSCATLCGQLFAVGGYEADRNTTAGTITGYNERTNSWEAMGDMSIARRQALMAIVNGEIMVVGGRVKGFLFDWNKSNVVEILC